MTSFIQRSFAGGEIAPAIYARSDQAKWATGLRTCRNYCVQRYGGLENRAGTKFVGECWDSTKKSKLVKFVYNEDVSYVLEFAHLKMSTYYRGELHTGFPRITSPYYDFHLPYLNYVQSGLYLFIANIGVAPQSLSFVFTPVFSTITFSPKAPLITAMTVNSDVGTYTLKYAMTGVDSSFSESLPATAFKTDGFEPSTAHPAIIQGTLNGAISANVYRALPNSDIYGFIGFSSGYFADDGKIPDFSDSIPIAKNPFTSINNYPGVVSIYQQRLIWASTINQPETIWMSRVGDYFNLTYTNPINADGSIEFTIAGKNINEVRSIIDIGAMVALTSSGEWLTNAGADGVIRPTDINLSQKGYIGASTLQPIVISNNALYVQARGTIVRDLLYNWETNGYQGNDLTAFANHLFDGFTIVAWDFQQNPSSIVWAVRSDGALLGLTYVKEHNIWAWHRHDSGGDIFEDVCVIPEGNEDAVYFIVKRTINGVTKRYIERMSSRVTNPVFLDSYITFDGRNTTAKTLTVSGGSTWEYGELLTLTASSATFAASDITNGVRYQMTVGDDVVEFSAYAYASATSITVQANKTVPASMRGLAKTTWAKLQKIITGLGHLEGREVGILADGFVEPRCTVSGGSITLTRAYAFVNVGLPIQADAELLDLERSEGETLIDKKKRMTKVTAYVQGTSGLLAGPNADSLSEAKVRAGEPYADPITPVTGSLSVVISGTWDNTGRVFIRNDDPLPSNILAIIREGSVSP
jgi:hypothetical protein